MSIRVEVWGDYACFSRPEMKVERVSYDVMTPSAARGLIEAVYWHPGLRWVIDRIHVCAPIRFTNIRRNEVKDVISAQKVRAVMERRQGELYLATPESIQQRAAMVLRNVRYVIDAHFDLVPQQAAPGDNPGKFQDIVKRRLGRGSTTTALLRRAGVPRPVRALPGGSALPRGTVGRARPGLDAAGHGLLRPPGHPPHVLPSRPARRRAGCPSPGRRGGGPMILQALVKLYEDLAAQGKIARPGWSPVQVSWALCLDAGGRLIQVIPIPERQKNGGSTAQSMELPTPVARSVNIDSNFLWDHSGYLLGIDAKGKPERSRQCFDACRRLHEQILDGVDSPISRAILAYFSQWQPARAAEHPALSDCLEEVRKGANLVFRVEGRFAQEDAAIRAAWQNHYDSGGDGPDMQCLVTGQMGPVARLHPAVKGVRGAQSSGASLVSFNAPAFCSYGREQSLNAPTGKYAAFAYTAALNHLLSDRAHVQRRGDTTVVFWAAGADPAYQAFSAAALFGGPPPAGLEEATLRAALKKLSRMERCAEVPLDPARPFYILGLSPNAARLSVRFFLHDCFGGVLSHVNAHHARMEIVRPANDPYETIPLWALLRETVPQTVRDKSPSPVLAGATARAILSNTDYPAALLNGVMLRIRADRKITRGRAAILKAYYLKNPPHRVSEGGIDREPERNQLHWPPITWPSVLRAGGHPAGGQPRHQHHHQGQVF
jgi:CRISPR-associated protein Csd1